ncbi:MAG: di-trans,poly-cis-decaprenylcistransferase [Alphaproteobacteria bacterium]|nr:di-trans,poly-cis-decaprenylcistransferase [Alphaproteobacteria bacterium]
MHNPPRHIAIVMDGNGRWAKKNGVRTIEGHRKGGRVAEDIAMVAKEMGIAYLTLYTFSSENWKRSPLWIAELLDEFTHYLEHKTAIFVQEHIRANFIGDRTRFPRKIQTLMTQLEDQTKMFEGLCVNFALGYGARQEITDAMRRMAGDVQKGLLKPNAIDENTVSSYLYTKDMPDPDLFIRTSGEMRVSNYLLWQIAYAELFFTQTLWPDFTKEEFCTIINNFTQRERCYGQDRHAA